MKRLFGIVLLVAIMICSCDVSLGNKNDSDNNEKSYTNTALSKEGVDDFCEILGELRGEGLLSGVVCDKEKCFNVTPESVARETECKIFKFSDSCASFVMIDNKVYALCEWFGGYGFVNAVPCDFDNDGNKDLLVASSWGSGLHRSIISVFNVSTKESTVIYDTSGADNPRVDLIVGTQTPSFSSKDFSDLPIYYVVYSVEIKVNDGNLADLYYVTTDCVGSVLAENGEIVFKPNENKT